MEYWRGLGKAIVGDLDDGYPTLPWSNPAHAFWIENRAGLPIAPIELLTEGLRHCDVLSSPSRVILDDWKDVVPGLHIPNYASGAWYHGLEEIRKNRHVAPPDAKDYPLNEQSVVIGWGGSVSHYDSFWFSGVREALARVCKERPNVFVKICGNDPRMLEQLDIPPAQKLHQPGVNPQDWPKVIATFDIGIAPLDLREGAQAYDQRRSWLKGVEYMLAGVPWIASQSEPYVDLESFGNVVENTEEAWHDTFVRLIDNLPEAERRAKRIKNRVAWKYTLEHNVDTLIGFYDQAIGLKQAGKGLPNVMYVNWQGAGNGTAASEAGRGDAAPAPVPTPLAAQLENADLERRRSIQRAAYNAANQWHKGLGLEFNGVALGNNMRYDLVQQFNRELLSSAVPNAESIEPVPALTP